MNFDDLPTPIIEKNPKRVEKALLGAFMLATVANTVLIPHYKLYSEDIHNECAELLEAEESNVVVRSWDRSKRVFNIWRDEGFSAGRVNDGTITAQVEACQNVSYLTKASIWYGTKIVDPVMNGENISFGEEKSTFEYGTDMAGEAARQTGETIQEKYDGVKDWFSMTWDNLTSGNDDDIEITSPPIIKHPTQASPQPSPAPDATEYNEYGDTIEPGLTDRAKEAWRNWRSNDNADTPEGQGTQDAETPPIYNDEGDLVEPNWKDRARNVWNDWNPL